MKLLYPLIILFTFSFAEEKWEYLICETNTRIPHKSSSPKCGFKVLSDKNSEYNNLFDLDDFFSEKVGEAGDMGIIDYKFNNGLTWNEILINSLNRMGNDGWEIFKIQDSISTFGGKGNTYYFKRKVLKPVTKPLKKK